MHRAAIITLCAALASFAVAPPTALAQTHQPIAVSNAINPYICDADGDLADKDFSSELVNDNGHLVLRVKSVTDDETTYFCDNAGGVAKMTHPFALDSISAWVKTNGDFNPSDVYVEIYVKGISNVFYFNTTNARQGRTVNGYTFYTWKARDLVGLQGFPENPVISEFGFSVNVYTIGAGFITGVMLNSLHIPFAAHTILNCPFSSPSACVQ
jgi:hypothetical protein